MDFFSPVAIALYFITGFCAVLFMLIQRTKPIREVMYIRERDRRGRRLPIKFETARTLEVRVRGLNPMRFFKWGGAYVFHEGGRMVTRYFGKEGTAYTWKLKGGKWNILGTLYDGVKAVLGDEFVNKLRDDLKDKLKTSKVYVTVDLEEGTAPPKLPTLREEDIYDEQDRHAASILVERMRVSAKRELYQGLLWLCVGAMLVLLAVQLGWI